MSRALLPAALLLTLLAAACSSRGGLTAPAREPLPEPFRVLLLGDSISIGYTPHVEEALAGRAVVVRPRHDGPKRSPENCAGTNKGIEHIDRWLALEGGAWDVIHFNFGLHDLKRVHPETGKNSRNAEDPHQADPARYREQLTALVRRMKETNARLVFATTTPVPPGGVRPHREPRDSVEYNEVAMEVMDAEGVEVNDLFAFATGYPGPIQREADVHFTPEGSEALGARVTAAILEAAGLGTGAPVLVAPR
ncbi:MAG: SGNH/GDSL hydrolase family protein [Planctomycetota bacterium]